MTRSVARQVAVAKPWLDHRIRVGDRPQRLVRHSRKTMSVAVLAKRKPIGRPIVGLAGTRADLGGVAMTQCVGGSF
jgi:hypothetical protein